MQPGASQLRLQRVIIKLLIVTPKYHGFVVDTNFFHRAEHLETSLPVRSDFLQFFNPIFGHCLCVHIN